MNFGESRKVKNGLLRVGYSGVGSALSRGFAKRNGC